MLFNFRFIWKRCCCFLFCINVVFDLFGITAFISNSSGNICYNFSNLFSIYEFLFIRNVWYVILDSIAKLAAFFFLVQKEYPHLNRCKKKKNLFPKSFPVYPTYLVLPPNPQERYLFINIFKMFLLVLNIKGIFNFYFQLLKNICCGF